MINMIDAAALTILFFAVLARSTFGFGDALLAMPLLSMLVGLEVATPLVALVSCTVALIIVVSAWRQIDLFATWRLVAAAVLGVPSGVMLMRFAPSYWVIRGLGAFLIAFALYRLIAPRLRISLPELHAGSWAYVYGYLGGFLGSAYNVHGPPIALYGAMRRWPPTQFRASLQGFFLLNGLLIVTGHGLGSLWTAYAFKLFLLGLPVTIFAIALGWLLNKRIAMAKFEQGLNIAFLILGSLLFI